MYLKRALRQTYPPTLVLRAWHLGGSFAGLKNVFVWAGSRMGKIIDVMNFYVCGCWLSICNVHVHVIMQCMHVLTVRTTNALHPLSRIYSLLLSLHLHVHACTTLYDMLTHAYPPMYMYVALWALPQEGGCPEAYWLWKLGSRGMRALHPWGGVWKQ